MDDEDAGPSLQNKRVFAFADTGVPDGSEPMMHSSPTDLADMSVKCDHLGNVYSGCGDGLHVWSAYRILSEEV